MQSCMVEAVHQLMFSHLVPDSSFANQMLTWLLTTAKLAAVLQVQVENVACSNTPDPAAAAGRCALPAAQAAPALDAQMDRLAVTQSHHHAVDGVSPPFPRPCSPRTSNSDHVSQSDRSSAAGLEQLDEPECVVCWSAGAEVIFQPCGHFCTCENCAKPWLGVGGPSCPLCRTPVTSSISLRHTP